MKIELNGVEYEIKEVSQNEYKELRLKEDEDTGCNSSDTKNGIFFGASHHYTCKIYLDATLPKDRKRKTLLHELTHCYIAEYITHEDVTFDGEMVADIVANSFDIINNIIKKYFKEK